MNLSSITTAIRDGAARLFRAKPYNDGITRANDSGRAGLVSDFAIENFVTALTRIPDPDDVLRRAGMRRHDLKRLEFDDEISGALDTRREAAITSTWRLDGNDDEPTQFVRAELERVLLPLLRGSWEAVPYGYSVVELIWRFDDKRRLVIDRSTLKPMQWFEPLRDGRLIFEAPHSGIRQEVDKRLKFVLTLRSPTYANPFGEALLSRLYWAWYFRHSGWKAWMQFVDRFGDPFVVGKSTQPKELVESLLGMGVRNVIGIGSEDDLEVLVQNGGDIFDRLDQRLTERIAKMILGQTLTSASGHGGSGSYALGKVHEQVRQDKRLSDVRLLQAAGQQLVDALWSLNSFPGDAPRFVFADGVGVEVERADRDSKLVTAGIVTLTKPYLLRAYDYEEGDIDIPPPGTAPKLGDPNEPDDNTRPPRRGKRKGALMLSERQQRFTPEQDAIEELIDDAMDRAPGAPLSRKALRAAISGAKDADDLAARLAVLLDAESPGFADTLAKALFAADVLGYLHEGERE